MKPPYSEGHNLQMNVLELMSLIYFYVHIKLYVLHILLCYFRVQCYFFSSVTTCIGPIFHYYHFNMPQPTVTGQQTTICKSKKFWDR